MLDRRNALEDFARVESVGRLWVDVENISAEVVRDPMFNQWKRETVYEEKP